jgi:hypothetical protein
MAKYVYRNQTTFLASKEGFEPKSFKSTSTLYSVVIGNSILDYSVVIGNSILDSATAAKSKVKRP